MKIGVIGGGPAGMLAAIEASRKFSNVTIIDSNLDLGRKLAATGAGRGNLTNTKINPDNYDAFDKFSFSALIQQKGYEYLINYFKEIGIQTYHTDDGWVYPISNSAKNIAEYLAAIIKGCNVEIINQSTVISINLSGNKFYLILEDGTSINFDKIIIATGGKAYPQLKASDSILSILKDIGHKIIPAYPALAPIETSKSQSDLLNGVRLNAKITLWNKNSALKSEFGNIIFTEWGVNGPGVMNLSHLIHKNSGNLNLTINFCYQEIRNLIITSLQNKNLYSIQTHVVLNPFFPKKIIDQIFKNSTINPTTILGQQSQVNISRLIESLTISEKVKSTRGFSYSQLSTGAVNSIDVNPLTLESNIIPGMYFAGEILDVIGPCGGYNLHWAFISGITAGRSL